MIHWYYVPIALAVGYVLEPLTWPYLWPMIRRLLGREVSKAGNAIAGDSTASKSPLR